MAPENEAGEAPLGATPWKGGGFRFRIWGPRAREIEVVYPGHSSRRCVLDKRSDGYFEGTDPRALPGERYWLRVDHRRLPDPASRAQPEGTGGPSQLVDLTGSRPPVRAGHSVDLARAVLYELHIGAFTPEGTFEAAVGRLDGLADLGVTAVELLPVGAERGERGWGYGPVHQFAVRPAYGGPGGLLRFVAAAHDRGLSVLLDIVYNHWSSQAKFLERFGPYFHPRALTPWGPTPNLDHGGSDEVRRYFLENAAMWLEEYGVDGFRIDAVHETFDRTAHPFWAELAEHCRAVGARTDRRPVLIAESDLNDIRILRPVRERGWGLDAQWTDDFHSALHAVLTGERDGYYVDFGSLELLARAFEHPFLLEGGYSRYKDRRHGAPADDVPPFRFVVFDQNHDQVGNRGDGARLTTLLPESLARVALGLTLFAPYVPMLFMGEEFGARRPFYFFADPPPIAARRLAAARIAQLRAHGFAEPPPDPSLPSTFERSRLDWSESETSRGRGIREFVARLIRLRSGMPALRPGGRTHARAWEAERLLLVRRASGDDEALLLANLGTVPGRFPGLAESGRWEERFSSVPAANHVSTVDRPGTPLRAGAPYVVGPQSFVIVEKMRAE